jgi:hypothetical protein
MAAQLVPLSSARADYRLQVESQQVYSNMHLGVECEKSGEYPGALKAFLAAYAALEEIQRVNGWERDLLNSRIDSCKSSIQYLQTQMAAQLNPTPTSPSSQPAPLPASFTTAPQAPRTAFQWKTAILAERFYIGEAKHEANEWNKGWNTSSLKDDPDNRNGFASGDHASTINPFYVALPFNDLAYPDKAKQYLPLAWQQSAKNGKSVCQHRWVEIKMEDGFGHICYAQWEDVGPLRNDHVEYLFGPERPDTGNRAGIEVSPAVAAYLGFSNIKGPINVRWRFIDDNDVPPGQWLKLDEEAVIYNALHHTSDAAPLPKPAPAASVNLSPGSTKP